MTTKIRLRKPSTARTPIKQESNKSLWSTAAKILAAIGAMGGLVLHLMGYVSHSSYLAAWGIDSGLFPQKTDEIIVLGYYAFIDRMATLFTTFSSDQMWKLLGISLFVTLYIFAVVRVAKSSNNNKAFHLFRKIPEWLSDLGKSFALTLMVLAGIPVALILAVFFLATPAIFGESFGKTLAENQLTTYSKGCNQTASTLVCIELCKSEHSLARGFLIEGSESHIAIFDVNQKRALAFEREGTHLLADTPRKIKEVSEIPEVSNRACTQITAGIRKSKH